MVAVGYQTAADGTYSLVNNPWPPNQGRIERILYDAYR